MLADNSWLPANIQRAQAAQAASFGPQAPVAPPRPGTPMTNGGIPQANSSPAATAPAAPMTATSPYAGGVVPMTVEPLNSWEKTGLSSLANPGQLAGGSMDMVNKILQQMAQNPQAFAAQNTNPLATQYSKQAGDLTTASTAPITQSEVAGVANPFSAALKDQLTQAGQKARAAITANQGLRGARSFGDTSQGNEMGLLDQGITNAGANIDYSTFQDALSQLQAERGRTLSAGGQLGTLATGAQGITSNASSGGLAGLSALFGAGSNITQQGLDNIKNQIGAGNYVRTYNQGVNDLIGQDIQAGNSYPTTNLTNIMNLLKNFQSGTAGAVPGANSLETAGGGLTAGSGLLGILAQMNGASPAQLNAGAAGFSAF